MDAPVVVIGGGFAGLTLAQHLTPMLAEVAARTGSATNVIVAGRQATKRTHWIAATVSYVNLAARQVHFDYSHGGKGQPSRTLYLIQRGTSLVRAEDGSALKRYTPGEQFGILAAERTESSHATTVVAESALDVVAIDRPAAGRVSNDIMTSILMRLLDLARQGSAP